MEIKFVPITINAKEIITSFTLPSNYQNCDFSFSNMCSWRFLYDSEFAVIDNFLLIRFWIENKKRVAYMMPVGNGNLRQAISLLEEDSLRLGHPLCMLGITPDAKRQLEEAMPGDFYYIPERDYFDYIYLREDLISLKGKKLQPKRNHINKFTKTYPYEYISITPGIVSQCLDLERLWFNENKDSDDEKELNDERRSLQFALQHSEELGLIGGAIKVAGNIVAFSFGAPINHNTFGTHVEKADVNYEGAYAIINKEFAAHLPEQYTYINREEDLGIPGLRQAKLSYNPAILLEKCAVIKRSESGKRN